MLRRFMWPMRQAGEWRFGPLYAEAAEGWVDAALGMGLDGISVRGSEAA
jgi:hypothetical protein